MPTTCAGILLYRCGAEGLDVLRAHPGGPFFQNKDLGSWTIPKGRVEEGEDPLSAARREFREETGFVLNGPAIALGKTRQRRDKIVHAWAVRGDADPGELCSNAFEMEWPRGSGQMRSFPEVDRAEWFDLAEARRRILPGQALFLDELETREA